MLPGMAAGMAAGTSKLHPALAWLQLPALALLGWSLARAAPTPAGLLRPGFWFGAVMAGVVLGNVGVPAAASALLFVALTAYWMAMGAGLSALLRRGDLLGVTGAAGLLTLGEAAQTMALPLFGTAQRLASAWVESDLMLPVARLGGTLAITFLVALAAFSLSAFVASPARRTRIAASLLLPLAAASGTAALLTPTAKQTDTEPRSLRVAVCGAQNASGAILTPDDFLKKYLPLLESAAAQGARLAVTPEMALFADARELDATLARCEAEARRLNIAWALGFSRSLPSLNQAVLLNADKAAADRYTKTHRVPFLEQYSRDGDARAVTGLVGGVRVGLMICQDDNFEDVARNLALAGTQLAAVPTFDWPGVDRAHLASTRNRPREHGFALARAAIGGVSAVITPNGQIAASRDHLLEGDGLVVASVAVGSGAPTPHARLGDLPVLALSALCLTAASLRRKS